MTEQAFVWKDQKKLRMGYTTGSCAAAAAKAAARMLFLGEEICQVSLMTPKGIRLYLDVEDILRTKDKVRCAIRKDAGDDPDVTDQILVYAEVSKTEGKQITLDGGVGVGRITRKGLEQDIGDAAINKVPRAMIREAVEKEKERGGYTGGLSVVISIPDGAELAKKTFNPRLGIEGGLSVLGTTGIVEPMSEKALTDTIFLEMKMLRENGNEYCYLVPGNYGSDFLKEALGCGQVQQLHRGIHRSCSAARYERNSADRTCGQTDQGGGRSDEYALQTGGLQDGSICLTCGDGGG